MPGILTGIAAVIVALGGVFAALNIDFGPQPQNTTEQKTQSLATVSTSSQSVCGTQLPDLNLFGSWRWIGTANDIRQSGLFVFSNDCTYSNNADSDSKVTDEGHFIVSSSPPSIKFQNKDSGKEHTYLITNISEKSFRLSDLDNSISLGFIRES
jgi:hypothetical protein